MRIERITIDLCVADFVTREDIEKVVGCISGGNIMALEVVCEKPAPVPEKNAGKAAKHAEPKQKRKYTKRSTKWTASNSKPEKTDGSVKRVVRTNANGETETVRDGEHEGEKIIFRK